MIIDINLQSQKFVSLGEQKILLPEDVYLRFASSVYNLGTLIVSVSNGSESKKYKTMGEPIDITPLCAKAGEIKIEASLVINCEPVKNWRIESLLICEVEHELKAIPEIEALKTEINKCRTAITELAQLLKENTIF